MHAAMVCHEAVCSAEIMWEGSDAVRSGKLDDMLPGRPLRDDWLKMYRDHKRVFRVLAEVSPIWEGQGDEAEHVVLDIRALSRYAKSSPDELKAELGGLLRETGHKRVRAFWRLSVREARKDYLSHLGRMMVRASRSEPDDGWLDETIVKHPELVFFLRVMFPCLLQYCMLPCDLLRQARQGDKQAIENLLRLDDAAASDPRIQHWIDGVPGRVRRARVDQVRDWTQRGPVGRADAWHFKLMAGGLVSAVSHKACFMLKGRELKPRPLNAPQIMQLFDAWYRDKSGRREAVMSDPAFARVTPHAWSSGVRRYRKQWERVLFRADPHK